MVSSQNVFLFLANYATTNVYRCYQINLDLPWFQLKAQAMQQQAASWRDIIQSDNKQHPCPF